MGDDVDVGLTADEAHAIDLHHPALASVAGHDLDVQSADLGDRRIDGVGHRDRVGQIVAFQAVLESESTHGLRDVDTEPRERGADGEHRIVAFLGDDRRRDGDVPADKLERHP